MCFNIFNHYGYIYTFLSLSHYLNTESEKILALFGTVIGNLCSESQNEISEDLKY